MTDTPKIGPPGVVPHNSRNGTLVNALERVRKRRETARKQGEPSLARSLAMAGAYGWMIVVPTLAGLALGRWFDDMAGSGITFAAALIMIGCGLGFRLVWVRMHRE